MNQGLPTSLLLLVSILPNVGNTADDGTYLNISAAEVTYEEDLFPDLNPTALVFKFGKIYSTGLGFEGRFGASLDSDQANFDAPLFANSEVDIELDLLYGIYITAKAGLGGNASVFAVAGASVIELTKDVNLGGFVSTDEEKESGVSYGAGINFGPSDNTHLTIEFMSYIDESDVTISTVSLGLLF